MASMLKVTTADIENEERALEEEMKQRTHQIMLLKLRKKIGEIETMVNEGNVTMSEAKAAFKVFTDSNTDGSSSSSDGSAGETKTTMVETEVAEAAPTKEEEIVSVKAKCLLCFIPSHYIFFPFVM
tara:strand:- start:26 stop:403 length:378 start_codon:yes stop_codon:yes gene_type:complete